MNGTEVEERERERERKGTGGEGGGGVGKESVIAVLLFPHFNSCEMYEDTTG